MNIIFYVGKFALPGWQKSRRVGSEGGRALFSQNCLNFLCQKSVLGLPTEFSASACVCVCVFYVACCVQV